MLRQATLEREEGYNLPAHGVLLDGAPTTPRDRYPRRSRCGHRSAFLLERRLAERRLGPARWRAARRFPRRAAARDAATPGAVVGVDARGRPVAVSTRRDWLPRGGKPCGATPFGTALLPRVAGRHRLSSRPQSAWIADRFRRDGLAGDGCLSNSRARAS